MIRIKRAYEAAAPEDGRRILVDRLWPRGVTKEGAKIDEWAKDLAPSTELRKFFHADPTQWAEFERRYRVELKAHGEELKKLAEEATKGPVTLVYGAKDRECNQAVVLKELIEDLSK